MPNFKLDSPAASYERKALENMSVILGELLDSAPLDNSSEAKDCLEVFDQHEWEMKPGGDTKRFQQLKVKGVSNTMTLNELDEFIGMVTRDGQTHVYFSIMEAKKALEEYRLYIKTLNSPSSPEEYSVCAVSTGHLTQSDRDALKEAALSNDPMIMKRLSGFFVKLYPHDISSNYHQDWSESLKNIICWVHESGYQMIEFDCDAGVLPQFPVFDW